jgi:hypothetical protein
VQVTRHSDHVKHSQQQPDESAREQRRLANIAVGVTGHRPSRLAGMDAGVLAERVRDALATICRATSSDRLIVVSPVAEGADRIVARVALETGHELHCVLPFARETYLRDFPTVSSRAEYNALLSLASEIIELDGSTATPEARDAAYSAVGGWVVDHSRLLIAIWDGGEARGNGGTGDVVHAAIDGGLPVIWIASQAPHATRVLTQTDGAVTEHALADAASLHLSLSEPR